ncbi:MAG: efflux RND transporter permease subunit [Planctomycetota bacterium]
MNLPKYAITHKPITLVFAGLVLVAGILAFGSMPRRENPRITIRAATVETFWPGASAARMEELVTEKLEDAIAQIEEVDTIESMSRTGYSRIDITLLDSVLEDTLDQSFDLVRDKVDMVRGQLPEGCGEPFVNSDFGDVSSVCVVIHAKDVVGDGVDEPYSYRELELVAEALETELKRLDAVASVSTFGVPDETITLEIESAEWSKLGLTKDELASAIDRRNIANSGAVVVTPERRFPVRPTGELVTTDAIASVPVRSVEDGRAVTVRDLPFEVIRGPEDPRSSGVRFMSPESRTGRAVLMGITMKQGENVVQLGEDIEAVVERFRQTQLPAGLEITRVNDLPRQVSSLIADFVESLWQAIAIVLGVAWLMMGWRPALVMATAIPLCMVSAIAIVPQFGVELEQFAIASLIIVLGMVVDNAIVVTDNVQRLLNEGMDREQAAIEGSNSLARSILSSTLTTVGAFLPMLIIPGATGEYMRSLPIVVSATLLSSYVVAMTVTPIMCVWMLKPKKVKAEKADEPTRVATLYTALIRWCMSKRLITIGAATLAVVMSLGLIPVVGTAFFPEGVRDQFFVHITAPAGTSLEETERIAEEVEDLIRQTSTQGPDGSGAERLVSATTFVGNAGPRMILSLDPEHSVPHYAMILVNTSDATGSRAWVDQLREEVAAIPGARIDVRPFMTGPPVDNPVEFRLVGTDVEVMRSVGRELLAEFGRTPGTIMPFDDWGEMINTIDLEVDPERAYLAGVTSRTISEELDLLYGGGQLTTLREGDHLVEVVLRLTESERETVETLDQASVRAASGTVPLTSVAGIDAGSEYGAIGRRNRERSMTVGSQAGAGFLANNITMGLGDELAPIIERLPQGYRLEVGGEAEESAEAQGHVSQAFGVSIVLIFLVLLVQYNSLLKPMVVLTAFPLALIGAMFGLFLSGWPLGFMPLLGVVALGGTVINNAIVLIDFIESTVAGGAELRDAVAQSGLVRMKPILLTTLTTVGGLLPLALFGGPMWAGMSWAMIGGLSLSTGLTLVVIPTIYVLFAERFKMRVTS